MKRAGDFGFDIKNNGKGNSDALQRAVVGGGTIFIDEPGEYKMAQCVRLQSNTRLIFSPGVKLLRENVPGGCYLFINEGAYTGNTDENIQVIGLNIATNGCCISEGFSGRENMVPGLRGQIAFFRVKNLTIRDFTCLDLPKSDFAIHICTFYDILLEDLHIEGRKDAVHLGTGSGFVIRHGFFRTFDDPIALNAHDYATSNPQLGWIENGLIEDCYDLDDEDTTGFFCRILAGSWGHWTKNMVVQNSDTVESEGRLYRVFMKPDGQTYKSFTKPDFASGERVLDGIRWVMVQENDVLSCGCRNIRFTNIHLQKKRPIGFSIHFDHDYWSRSVYPCSEMPVQESITFDHIYIENEVPVFLRSITPMDRIRVLNTDLGASSVKIETLPGEEGHFVPARLLFSGCSFDGDEPAITCENEREYRTVLSGNFTK